MAKKQREIERVEIREKLKEAAGKPIMDEDTKKNLDMVEFSGLEYLDNLDPINLARFQKLCVKYAEKIERMLDNATNIKVHIKATHKGGKQRKYEMDVKAISPTKTFSGRGVEWDIEKLTHMCFKDIEKQITHHFKSDTSYRKSYA